MLAVNWQAGGGEIEVSERERERGKEEEECRMSACRREGENQKKKKRGRAQTQAEAHTHTHTHPLLSLQSGLGVQEAACASMCCRERVCVYRVQRARCSPGEASLIDARIPPLFAPGEDTC